MLDPEKTMSHCFVLPGRNVFESCARLLLRSLRRRHIPLSGASVVKLLVRALVIRQTPKLEVNKILSKNSARSGNEIHLNRR